MVNVPVILTGICGVQPLIDRSVDSAVAQNAWTGMHGPEHMDRNVATGMMEQDPIGNTVVKIPKLAQTNIMTGTYNQYKSPGYVSSGMFIPSYADWTTSIPHMSSSRL
jgi:hypothetical protein